MGHSQLDFNIQTCSVYSFESMDAEEKEPFIYDDFSTPNRSRNYPLIVGKTIFYVNPGYLSEYSIFFSKFFNNKKNVDISLLDNTEESDFLELLRVLHYCPIRKPIDDCNAMLCFNLSNLFQIGTLKKYTEKYINKVINKTNNVAILADIVTHLSVYDNTSDSYFLAINRLVKLEDDKFCCSDTWNHLSVDVFDDVISLRYHYRKYKKLNRFCERVKNWMGRKNIDVSSY
ncbi:BTB/POZ-like domain and BTB/POZ fold domain and BTB/POZ domain-containing protein [Strongyloides ratti]|uniref:BTB/POZ-like domain and BTB/POZ fold domain and BTB/POZ domain-containing protein n=1 Tax=Strongyloides ratti TaxID=34506 RepID=A0A090LHU3_STRRB|nr:BTB/POZ-like domain and BTB/POZ fold domain and BTB/POZ domain-containing protein [Strongyloides ratti]CEF67090.1 BTB/POZ-like domain and BTB/POZ fold domain and BTB/POZ domain-containing protein [Strongyloides ratti]